MIKTIDKNLQTNYIPFLNYIPQSLVIENKIPYFLEFEYKTEERVELQDTVISDTFKERVDPYAGHSTLISKRRSLRPQPDLEKGEYEKSQSCLFDDLEKVAHPYREFSEIKTLIAPNPFAFNPGFHDIVFTKDHIEMIEEIEEAHIYGILKTLRMRAQEIKKNKGIDQLDMGMNFGTSKLKYSSGASQPHLHAQIGAVYKNGFMPTSDRISYVNKKFLEIGIDYEELYMEASEKSELFILKNDDFILFAPFSPRFKDEIHIISKDRNIPNITVLTDSQLNSLSQLLFKAIKGLRELKFENEKGELTDAGIDSFNIEFLGLRFQEESGRMLIQIIPRESEIAYSELLERFIIDRTPEVTSKYLRTII
jgi:galactose-1-phosphate uridylyltransferase